MALKKAKPGNKKAASKPAPKGKAKAKANAKVVKPDLKAKAKAKAVKPDLKAKAKENGKETAKQKALPVAKPLSKAELKAAAKAQQAKAQQAKAAPIEAAPAVSTPAPGKKGKGKGKGKNAANQTYIPGVTLADPHSSEAVCREVACENLATTGGYCRLHYIKNWKKIKRKELILREKKLNQYIEELVAKYPDKYIEAIRQDLASDRDFAKVIHDLDLDESIDDIEMDGESVDNLIEGIRRDFDDDDHSF